MAGPVQPRQQQHHHHRLGYEDSLNFTTSLCLAYLLTVSVLRAWIRQGIYGSDDGVIAAATLFCLGHIVANYVALEEGAGKPWSVIRVSGTASTSLNQAYIVSVVTFTVTLYLSKCAVVVFLLRLTKAVEQIRLYRVCLAILALSGVTSVLLVTIAWPSNNGFYWVGFNGHALCQTQILRWDVFTALDLATEFMLMVLPLCQIWNLQMNFSKKAVIIAAFYLRLPVMGVSIGRWWYTHRLCNRGVDLGLDSALVLIWFTVQVSYAVISSTFSALRAFTMGFNSGWGLGFVTNAGPESYTMSRVYRNGTNISATAAKQSARVRSRPSLSAPAMRNPHGWETCTEEQLRPSLKLQPTPMQNFAQISADRASATIHDRHRWREEDSVGSDRGTPCDDMVIVRETEYTVQHHEMNDESPILPRA